jgi:hypothetical protein
VASEALSTSAVPILPAGSRSTGAGLSFYPFRTLTGLRGVFFFSSSLGELGLMEIGAFDQRATIRNPYWRDWKELQFVHQTPKLGMLRTFY